MKLDPILAIEACYAGVREDSAWLARILEALAPLDAAGAGMFAQIFRMGPDGRRSVEASVQSASLCRGGLDRVDESFAALGRRSDMWAPTEPVDFALRRAAHVGPEAHRHVARLLARAGIEDTIGIFAAEPGGRVALVAAAIGRGARRPGPRTLHQLKLFSAHLGASLRLRRALSPCGDALGAPPGAEGRASLTEAVRRLDRARGPLRHRDADGALRLWHGLVEGTWSLVDRCDREGRRYVLARRNLPEIHDPKALTERERAVVAFASLGHQNKLIAYLLGLQPSAVAAHLSSARRKLGLASRAELVHEFAALVRPGPPPGGDRTPGANP